MDKEIIKETLEEINKQEKIKQLSIGLIIIGALGIIPCLPVGIILLIISNNKLDELYKKRDELIKDGIFNYGNYESYDEPIYNEDEIIVEAREVERPSENKD